MWKDICAASVLLAVLLAAACKLQPALPPDATECRTEGTTSVVEIRPPALAEKSGVASARYETRFRDPVLEEIRNRNEKREETADEETGAIRKRQKDKRAAERLAEKQLQSSLPAAEQPASLAAFAQVPHLPPVPQDYSGTCWSFATTSLLESEAMRTSGRSVKLSEMATVYWEYLAKASRFIRERGESALSPGSEANAVTRIWSQHGAWPRAAFPGLPTEEQRHDHERLHAEWEAMLGSFESAGLWDEAAGTAMLRVILDRQLGRPPESFAFEGKAVRPEAFMREVLRIDPEAYVDLMSTLRIPFYTRGEIEVEDNWWHDAGYHNLPLDDLYAALEGALQKGYSASIAIDTSEPGHDGQNDVMFVPDYDIPGDRIDQLAREYRLAHEVTTDDHGVHVVGFAEHAGHGWFLAKDSGRSARRGAHRGYFFIRDDYVRLKMLAMTVHRDAVAGLLAKFLSP